MWNIIIGIVFIVGGLSGKLALIGTNSGEALAAVGAGLLVWGVVQMVRAKKAQTPGWPGLAAKKAGVRDPRAGLAVSRAGSL